MLWYSCWTKKTLKAKIIIQIKKFKVHDKQKQNQEIDKYKVFYKYKNRKTERNILEWSQVWISFCMYCIRHVISYYTNRISHVELTQTETMSVIWVHPRFFVGLM
jgi:hypothetical protein